MHQHKNYTVIQVEPNPPDSMERVIFHLNMEMDGMNRAIIGNRCKKCNLVFINDDMIYRKFGAAAIDVRNNKIEMLFCNGCWTFAVNSMYEYLRSKVNESIKN